MKQTETLTLTISGTDITLFTKTFIYILYDCTQTNETTKSINWVIDSTSVFTQTVNLANTIGMFYVEYCTPYLFELEKDGTSVSLPNWISFVNNNPITNNDIGPSISIGTNQINNAGSYVLKKQLMKAGNQEIKFNLNLCGLTVPAKRFPTFDDSAQTALKLISS